MLIHIISGHGERGKSTVLKLLAVKLLKKTQYSNNDIKAITKEIDEERKDRRNRRSVSVRNIKKCLTINGKKVCICSAGDNEDSVKRTLDFFTTNQCDIGFCAARSKGRTLEALRNFENLGRAKLVFHKKAVILNATFNNIDFPEFDDYIDKLNEWEAEELGKLV